MIIVLIFTIIIMSSLLVGYYILLPLSGFNTSAINKMDTNITSVQNINIKSDLTDNQINDKKTLDFLNENYSFNEEDFVNNGGIIDELGTYTEIEGEKIQNNNIITDQVINNHKFGLELQLVPFEDFDTFVIYTNDSIQDVIVQQKTFLLDSEIKTINEENSSLEIKGYLRNLSEIYNNSSGDINKKIYGNISKNSDLIQFISENYYDTNSGEKYTQKIELKPFYNIDRETGNVIVNNGGEIFKKGSLYLIKLYFIIDPDKVNNLKIYIPNGSYITLNNIVKIMEKKQGNKYYFNKVKIIKNGLINKVNKNEYGF